MRLLIAEDSPKLLKSLVHIFEVNGYVVDGVDNGTDALAYAQSGEYDGLVLDVMMPGLDGIEVLRRLREGGVSTPTLFLTARTEVDQRVEGLDAGADDYLPKPFATPELLSRVRAMLRRRDTYTPDLLTYGPITLNRSTSELVYGDVHQKLGGKELQLMEMLMERPDSIVTTEQFMAHAWDWDSSVDTSVVWVHVSNLRKKIEALGAPVGIQCIRSKGYMLTDTGTNA